MVSLRPASSDAPEYNSPLNQPGFPARFLGPANLAQPVDVVGDARQSFDWLRMKVAAPEFYGVFWTYYA